jgi:hypothetical protein
VSKARRERSGIRRVDQDASRRRAATGDLVVDLVGIPDFEVCIQTFGDGCTTDLKRLDLGSVLGG